MFCGQITIIPKPESFRTFGEKNPYKTHQDLGSDRSNRPVGRFLDPPNPHDLDVFGGLNGLAVVATVVIVCFPPILPHLGSGRCHLLWFLSKYLR